jgi:Mannosyltransferase (PIG-V)
MTDVTERAAAAPSVDAPPDDPGVPGHPWRPSLVVAFWTWLAGLLMYCLVTAVSWLPFGTPPALDKAYESWHRWDTTWYVIIADLGYRYDDRAAAFFPLYPMLVRGVDQVLPRGAFEAALVVSVLACYAALVMVHRLATTILGPDAARRATFYLLAFPTGFYLAAAYAESLFIALSVGALYFMRRRQWWMAGVLGGFASATRLVGVLLALAFAYEYLRQRRFSPRRVRLDALAVGLVPVGLLLYAAYCWRVFGDPLFFLQAQEAWFRAGYQAPWSTLGEVLRMVLDTHPLLGPTSVRNIINLTTAVAVLALLAISLDREWGLGPQNAYLAIFSVGIILLPVINPIEADYPLSSLWRFALECVPVFLLLARYGRNQHFDRVYTTSALAVQGVMILTFVQNQFVA